MPDGYGRGRVVGVDAVGDQQVRRNRVVGLGFVGHRLDAVAVLADRLAKLRPQVARFGPRSAKALEQLFAESCRCGLVCPLRRRQQRLGADDDRCPGRGLRQEIATLDVVVVGWKLLDHGLAPSRALGGLFGTDYITSQHGLQQVTETSSVA